MVGEPARQGGVLTGLSLAGSLPFLPSASAAAGWTRVTSSSWFAASWGGAGLCPASAPRISASSAACAGWDSMVSSLLARKVDHGPFGRNSLLCRTGRGVTVRMRQCALPGH